MPDSITPAELQHKLDEGANIAVLDVRKPEDRVEVAHTVPGAQWRDPGKVDKWCGDIAPVDEVIVYCVHGHNVSKGARDALRQRGKTARIVEGGITAWCEYMESR